MSDLRLANTARHFLVLLLAFAATACMTVRLVSPYDEQLDQGLTQLYADTSSFMDRMVTLAGRPEGTYAANQEFYSNAIGRVDSMIARAQGNQVMNGCPSTQVMGRILNAAHLPDTVRQQVGTIPPGACEVVLLELLKANIQTFRTIHTNQGAAGITPFLRDQAMEGGIGSLLRSAIMVEVAKRSAS